MPYIIRKNIFETNSSSSHSLTLDDTSGWQFSEMEADANDTIVLGVGQYGWEQKIFTDPVTKADYLAVLYSYKDPLSKLMLRATLEKIILKNSPHIKHVEFRDDGYIDHQSVYFSKWMFNEKDVKTFIYNKSSSVTTGNDNE